MDSNYIGTAEKFVKDRLAGEGTGHDWWHVVRISNTARKIHEKEGGDWQIIYLALLLHDVGDWKVVKQEKDDYTIAENFMIETGIDKKVIDEVMFIIKNMSFSKSLDVADVSKSIEFQIVQDADRLDAIGAIGVGRAFAFGGSRARMMYNPDYTTQQFASSADYRSAESSTIHHFHEKLFFLKDKLNTATAKQIAEDRDKFMRQFVDEFMAEWDGER